MSKVSSPKMPYDITNCKETKLGFSPIKSQLNFLKGKVLTVIDASIQDEIQRKAIKDLIHNAFEEQIDWIYQLCGLPSTPDTMDISEEKNYEQKIIG